MWANSHPKSWAWVSAGLTSQLSTVCPSLLLQHCLGSPIQASWSPALRPLGLAHPHSYHKGQLPCFAQARYRVLSPNCCRGHRPQLQQDHRPSSHGLCHDPSGSTGHPAQCVSRSHKAFRHQYGLRWLIRPWASTEPSVITGALGITPDPWPLQDHRPKHDSRQQPEPGCLHGPRWQHRSTDQHGP